MLIIAIFMLSIVTTTYSNDRMTKVVFKQVYPKIQSDGFSQMPMTIYTCGRNMGRVEEPPDSSIKLHQLIIYNNGHSWMINLFDSTGIYIKDPGPSFNFYATIFPVDSLLHFEFGREQAFFAEREIKQHTQREDVDVLIQEARVSEYTILLYTNTKTEKPSKVELYDSQRQLQTAYEYLEYSTDLSLNESLFNKPTGIKFNEQPDLEEMSEQELSYHIHNFYKNPHDTKLLTQLVKGVTLGKILQAENAKVPMIGFFCGAFKNNPDVDWKVIIESSELSGREVLLEALHCAENGDPEFTNDISPALNDFYWSKYFATGDTDNLLQIIEHLSFSEERRDPYFFLAAGSAKWSLSSNIKEHEEIQAFVENQIKKQTGVILRELKDLMKKSPEVIQQEMIDTMKQNQGNWEVRK